MNERVKKLAIQAAGKGFETFATSDFDSQEKIQKFAELIVRECLEQVRDEVQYEYDWRLADAVTKRVLEHFGVE